MYINKKLFLVPLILLFAFLLTGCSADTDNTENISESNSINTQEQASEKTNYVSVKYRDGSVDLAHSRWEYLNTSKSSWVRGAWYDDNNNYMIINLNGTNYHYCGLSSSIWESFKSASSFGSHYNSCIKGNYSCR